MDTQAEFARLIDGAASTKDKLFYSALQLFSQKGFANVGIRELCRTVHIKESSFYNHYASKESLFEAILRFFDSANRQVVMTDNEIQWFIQNGDVRKFFIENMKRFSSITSNVLYHTALQIVLTEAFLHPAAARLANKNLYYLRRGYTERVLSGLMERGAIRRCDVEAVTAEYYYALKAMLDEYLLLELQGDDLNAINARIHQHIGFFVQMLRPDDDERSAF